VNPVFVLPEALAARTEALAKGWATSLTMGAGQFCTNPGILVLQDGPEADAFAQATTEALRASGPRRC
jgi:NADP-dependent aldehyde dehydrogenase